MLALKNIKHLNSINKCFIACSLRGVGKQSYSSNVNSKFTSRQQQNTRKIGPLGWFLLVVILTQVFDSNLIFQSYRWCQHQHLL